MCQPRQSCFDSHSLVKPSLSSSPISASITSSLFHSRLKITFFSKSFHPYQQWRSQGGTLVQAPRRRMDKFFKSSRFGSVTTGYDTVVKFWSAWFTAWVWTACADMIVQYRVQQNQFLVILVHLRCFVVICLTFFFVFNTVLCFLVCSLSTEEVSVTVLVFLVLYIFCLFSPLKDRYHSVCVSSFWGLRPWPPPGFCPWTPLGGFRPQIPCFVPPLANFWLRPCLLDFCYLLTAFMDHWAGPDWSRSLVYF